MKKNIGVYELGCILGEGTFAKVRLARNTASQQEVAIKILDKKKLFEHEMADQIKREISIMKVVKHPCVVDTKEVLATTDKIYIVLQLVTGGDLFDLVVNGGRLNEEDARRHFNRLIEGVDYCHSKGVYHRDLKPENLLLDSEGNLLISDFGLSALPQQLKSDGLLHTTCGTPNYVAPELLDDRGYDGRSADIWACGVILYVLLCGCLPFDEPQIHQLFHKIQNAKVKMPSFVSDEAKDMIARLLDKDPRKRITAEQIRGHDWFKGAYVHCQPYSDSMDESEESEVFMDVSEVSLPVDKDGKAEIASLNAFDLINMSNALALNAMFNDGNDHTCKTSHPKFTSPASGQELIKRITEFAEQNLWTVSQYGAKLKITETRNLRAAIAIAEVFDMTSKVRMVELRNCKASNEDFQMVSDSLRKFLKDIILK